MSEIHLRKYGEACTVDFSLFEIDGVDFRIDAVYASGDTTIMKNEGAEANTTNGFIDEGNGYSITLTTTEAEAARIVVFIKDQTATKVWLDRTIIIETYGHASAQHAMDLDDSVRGGLTALPNAAADAAGGLAISDAGGLDLDSKLANTNEITAARMGALTDWINGGRLDLLLDAIPTTAMRGTDSAATEAKQNIIDTNVDTLITQVGTAGDGLTNIDLPNQTMNITGTIDTVTTLTNKTGFSLAATGLDAISQAATGMVEIAKAVWDRILTAATHNIATSAGRRLRDIASDIVLTGTSPDTAGTANTAIRIELDGDASATDGAYDPGIVVITGGTGVGQARQIFEYDGTNKYAYINRSWKVIPDNTSTYTIVGHSGDTHINEGVATGGGNTSITLNVLASAVNDTYKGQIVFLYAGTGEDQARMITAYNGTTKVATVDRAWETNPANGDTIYAVLPVADLTTTLANIAAIPITKTGYSLSAAGIDSVLDEQIGDGTITMREALRVFIASLAGKASGGGTTTITFRDDADSKNVIVATVDVDGNRTATVLNP